MYYTNASSNTCTYSLYRSLQLTRTIIYIYTLLNVPLLEENPIRFKYIDRFNARTQILDVVVLNYQMLLLIEFEDLGLVTVQHEGVRVLFASGSFSYRVLKCIFLRSILSSVRNVFIHSDLLIYFSKDTGGFSL